MKAGETEAAFHEAMVSIYQRAKEECGYAPAVFLKMIDQIGALRTAKKRLASDNAQYGFNRLRQCDRLDLTVEAHVLKPEFAHLFTPEELQRARSRLQEHGYFDG